MITLLKKGKPHSLFIATIGMDNQFESQKNRKFLIEALTESAAEYFVAPIMKQIEAMKSAEEYIDFVTFHAERVKNAKALVSIEKQTARANKLDEKEERELRQYKESRSKTRKWDKYKNTIKQNIKNKL